MQGEMYAEPTEVEPLQRREGYPLFIMESSSL